MKKPLANWDSPEDLMIYLAYYHQKEIRQFYIVAFSLMVLALVFLNLTFTKSYGFCVFSIFFLGVGAKLGYDVYTGTSKRLGEFQSYFFDHPGQIVWVYTLISENMPFGFRLFESGFLVLKMLDKEEFIFRIPPKELKNLSLYLESELPHATFGYSSEKADLYNLTPDTLLRDKED